MFSRVPWSLSHVVLTWCKQHSVCFYSAEYPNHGVAAPGGNMAQAPGCL